MVAVSEEVFFQVEILVYNTHKGNFKTIGIDTVINLVVSI